MKLPLINLLFKSNNKLVIHKSFNLRAHSYDLWERLSDCRENIICKQSMLLLSLANPTIWFSLDHKRWPGEVIKRNKSSRWVAFLVAASCYGNRVKFRPLFEPYYFCCSLQ